MDALIAYNDSDESDEFSLEPRNEREYETDQEENGGSVRESDGKENRNEKCDYFGLNFDSDNEAIIKTELDEKKLTSRLAEQTALLHGSSYGPDYLRTSDDRQSVNTVEETPAFREAAMMKGGIKRVCEYQDEQINKKYQTEFQEHYKIESRSTDLFESDECKNGRLIFEPYAKIIQQISGKTCSRLPSRLVNKLDMHNSCISRIRWSTAQYSHLLLSSSLDGTLKIYNLFTKNCERLFKDHKKGVRAAVWTLCGTKIFSGGYDGKALLTDAVTGRVVNAYSHQDFVTSVQKHPVHETLFLSGTKNHVMVWDSRSPDQYIRKFSSNCGHVLDIAFLSDGKEVIFSSDIVSKDSADRTIIAWDFETGALLSNQIYQERYTCPCLRVEPGGANFIAQTNGSYIAIFSSSRPYKMNKKKRYEGHKVAGYNIECDFSADGSYVLTGDAESNVYIYETKNAKLVRKLRTLTGTPTSSVAWHPVLPSTIAVGTVTGHLQIWE